jgi:hypothetical protein
MHNLRWLGPPLQRGGLRRFLVGETGRKGDRKGYWSIRINDQFRICFRWDGKDAWDVGIVDYH